MKNEQLHEDRWYDRIHANHLCFFLWLFVMVLMLSITLVYCVPIWSFSAVETVCTVRSKEIKDGYNGDTYVTYHMYRGLLGVTYKTKDGFEVITTLYGPDNQGSFNIEYVTGYTQSQTDVYRFLNSYTIGQSYKCFYSRNQINRVAFTMDPAYGALLTLPCLALIIALFVCIYPPIEKYLRMRGIIKEQKQLYEDIEARVSQDQDFLYEEEQKGDYTAMVLARGGSIKGEVGDTDSVQVEDEDDDEWVVQEEYIETTGKFFGIEIEHDGAYNNPEDEIYYDEQDDVAEQHKLNEIVQQETEPDKPKQSILIDYSWEQEEEPEQVVVKQEAPTSNWEEEEEEEVVLEAPAKVAEVVQQATDEEDEWQ
ncbi:Pol polyprotein [Acrasis kona]|uniref:Pol polyprotein n=1 Tax=Acrasis kona TaxID=1008807 RepID=A0AAW2YGU4_9EUKA